MATFENPLASGMTADTVAGIIVLIALALLIAFNRGLRGVSLSVS